ncbi:MAG TPA: glycosyltransferase family 9 protein [Alphaproteobacteria bacterium]|nr:glycosyltransferase family 9 protein [Alphaproteobacteria bacterium]
MAASAPQTILVYVGRDLIGDGLIKLPFVRALRAAFPAARITWLAGTGETVYAGPLRPLVAGLIDEIIQDAGIGQRPVELLRRPLRGRSFDLIIDTQRRILTTLILRRIAHTRFMSAAAGYLLSDIKPDGRDKKPPALIRQLLNLVELTSGRATQPHAAPELPAALRDTSQHLLPDGRTYIGLAPGAGGRHKCWPLERFIALARLLRTQGKVPVFILGPAEAEWADRVHLAVPSAKLPLQDARSFDPLLTLALAERLAVAVANDSGGGHLLAAGGVPLVSLFGPSSPAKFAPLAKRLMIVTAQEFGGSEMTAIPVDAVAAAVESLLPG